MMDEFYDRPLIARQSFKHTPVAGYVMSESEEAAARNVLLTNLFMEFC